MTRQLVVVSAGLSSPSSTRLLADRIAQAVESRVGARGEAMEVHHVELRDLALPLAQAMTTGGLPDPQLDEVKRLVAQAHGLVAVTPIFRASYSGLFKMFFDVLDDEALIDLPVLIAATAGTPRHSLVLDHALRPLFSYSRAVVLPTGVFAATDDFGSGDTGGLESRIASRLRDGDGTGGRVRRGGGLPAHRARAGAASQLRGPGSGHGLREPSQGPRRLLTGWPSSRRTHRPPDLLICRMCHMSRSRLSQRNRLPPCRHPILPPIVGCGHGVRRRR